MKIVIFICAFVVCTSAFGQQLPKVKGSGIVVLEEHELEVSINTLIVEGDFTIVLSQGEAPFYSIETDDNLLEFIKFEVEDSTLTISANHRITRKKKLDIQVTLNTIRAISLDDGAKMEGNKTLKGERLNITAADGATFEFDVEYLDVVQLALYTNADGSIQAKTGYGNISLDNRASLDAYFVSDSLMIVQNDTAKMKLDGSVEESTVKIKDNGKFEAKEASLNKIKLNMSDSSDAIVNCKEQLEIYLEDSAVLDIYGDPEIKVEGLKNKARISKKE